MKNKLKIKFSILFGIALILATLLYAKEFKVRDSNNNIVWTIQGTGADTSRSYLTEKTMTLFHWYADTSGNDSVDIDLTFQVWGINGWIIVKTKTVTDDSTNDDWMITNTAIPSRSQWRLIQTGGSDNKKLSSILGEITFDSGN